MSVVDVAYVALLVMGTNHVVNVVDVALLVMCAVHVMW